MHKAGTTKPEVAPLTLKAEEIGVISDYLTSQKDKDRLQARATIEAQKRTIREMAQTERNYLQRMDESSREAKSYRESIRERGAQITKLNKEMKALPKVKKATKIEAKTDIQQALALAFVAEIKVHNSGRTKDLYITTRANSLFTTFAKKFSANSRWYRSKVVQAPLPAYTIRLNLTGVYSSLSNNDGALAITMAEYAGDTASFLPMARIRYSHRTHCHWGTNTTHGGYFNSICLGEYESDVTQAFRKGIAEGLKAFAIYLQTSGAQEGYIHTREEWALRLGKKEYNALLVPSEGEKLEEEAEETVRRFNEDGEVDDEGEYDESGNLLGDVMPSRIRRIQEQMTPQQATPGVHFTGYNS